MRDGGGGGRQSPENRQDCQNGAERSTLGFYFQNFENLGFLLKKIENSNESAFSKSKIKQVVR